MEKGKLVGEKNGFEIRIKMFAVAADGKIGHPKSHLVEQYFMENFSFFSLYETTQFKLKVKIYRPPHFATAISI